MDHLAPGDRARLEQLAEPLMLGPGEILIRKGERGADFFRLEAGSLEIVDTSARPEVVVDVVGPGTVLGEMAFLTRKPRSMDVRAGSDSQVLRWSAEHLEEALDADADFASAFYRATALVLTGKLADFTRAATGGALSDQGSGTDVAGARALADRIKQALLEVEERLRRDPDRARARKAVSEVVEDLIRHGGRLFASLSFDESASAGRILANELRPYLVRSRLGDLAINSVAAAEPRLLAHIELGDGEGADVFGQALDDTLLGLPTTAAIRDRLLPTLDAVSEALPTDRPGRVLLLPCGAGTTAARILPMMALRGGELTVADSDREALAFLNSGGAVASNRVRVRLVHEDLSRMVLYGSQTFFGPQDVIVLDGLLEYLPLRVVAALLPTLQRSLAGGATLVLNMLGPERDAFFFDQLLGWRTVRRDPEIVRSLMHNLGYNGAQITFREGAAAVVVGRQPHR